MSKMVTGNTPEDLTDCRHHENFQPQLLLAETQASLWIIGLHQDTHEVRITSLGPKGVTLLRLLPRPCPKTIHALIPGSQNKLVQTPLVKLGLEGRLQRDINRA